LELRVDTENSIRESNETNNSLILDFTVQKAPSPPPAELPWIVFQLTAVSIGSALIITYFIIKKRARTAK
jgi:subtilase family serine protease